MTTEAKTQDWYKATYEETRTYEYVPIVAKQR